MTRLFPRFLQGFIAACLLVSLAALPAAAQAPVPWTYLPMIGEGSTTPVEPTPVAGSRLHVAQNSSCLVTASGGVKCWGDSFTGLSGDVMYPKIESAVQIPGLSGIKAVSVGWNFACALTNAGGVKCWGENSSGQLGNNTFTDSLAPVSVAGLASDVKQVAVGDLFACALLNAGAMKCWGNTAWGQLGTIVSYDPYEPFIPYPVDVVGMSSGVTAISAGDQHACAIKNGGLWCWGSNEFGQVGNIAMLPMEYHQPMPVHTLSSGVAAVTAASENTCAITTGGGLKCWGRNRSGQVGNGTDVGDEFLPQDVTGLSSGVQAVAVGTYHTCALLTNATLKCWGSSDDGQVGSGEIAYSILAPTVVDGASGVLEVSGGEGHTCVLQPGGVVKCWGDNFYGQLGDGTFEDSLDPVVVVDH
jgi:alpha-tubulin suppressor-like RCC1 family protein